MTSQSYNIGQILYVLSNKKQAVIPAVVAEEDIRKVRKLDGVHEVVNYKVQIGPKDRQIVVELRRLDGEVFTSLEDMRAAMTARLTEFIDGLTKKAKDDVREWYGITADNQVLESAEPESDDKLDPEQLMHAVHHGTPLMPQQMTGMQQPVLNPHMTMQDNLRAMVDPGMDVMDPNGPAQVILPNGQVVKVRGG